MFSLERDYEFPRVIVWDALVDADLVSGWLAESAIAAELGGRYELRWSQRAGEPVTSGRITALRRPELLHVEAEELTMRFELEELSGGDRGTSTRLRLAVGVDPALAAARLEADWLTSLNQLRDLLFGHPVDWAGQDSNERALRYRDEVENSSA